MLVILFVAMSACENRYTIDVNADSPDASGGSDSGIDGDNHSDIDTDSDTLGDSDAGVDDYGAYTLLFSPKSGTFVDSITVEISAQAGDTIYYTTDGTTPSSVSKKYSGPISISATTEINAAIYDGDTILSQATAVYIPRTEVIKGDLPIVILDNRGNGEAGDVYQNAVFLAFDKKDGEASIANSADAAAKAAFHLRGQSSKDFDKRPYRLELRDIFEDDKDIELLGMPAESDWVLRNPYVDKSLIRDAFHYTLGQKIGMEAPRYQFVEFYKNIDGDEVEPDDYEGVYLLMETIKNCKRRLDLKELDPEDTDADRISGGYIFKAEWLAAEEPLLVCPVGDGAFCWGKTDENPWGGMGGLTTGIEVVDPGEIEPAQLTWLSNHIYDFSEALHTTTLADAQNYTQFVDINSFVDQVIINEIGRELDSYIRSAYFYKDRNDVIFAGPLWDYNLSLGIGMEYTENPFPGMAPIENAAVEGWMLDVNAAGRTNPSIDWFFVLMKDPGFESLVKTRWRELRQNEMADSALLALVDNLVAALGTAPSRNFKRWDVIQKTHLGAANFYTPSSDTWEEQITYLKQWLTDRTKWIDSQWQ